MSISAAEPTLSPASPDTRLPIWLTAAAVIASTILSFTWLDQTPFWDDEAQTAILARNLLHTGKLTGWDGRNLWGYSNGRLLDENLPPRNPPLDVLLAAGSFALLGPTTFAGRLPFVLCGLGSLILFAWLTRRTWPEHPWITVYATAAMGLSMPFILNVRQCRYYALAMLLAVLTLVAYEKCRLARMRGHMYRGALFLALAALGFFFTNYLMAAAFLFTLAICHWFFHARGTTVRGWMALCMAGAVCLAVTLPYAWVYRIWARTDFLATTAWHGFRHLVLTWNLRDLDLMSLLPLPLFLGVLVVLWCWRDRVAARRGMFWLALLLGYVLILSLLSPPVSGMRWLHPLVPLAAGLIGILLAWIHTRAAWVALLLLAILLGSNVLSGTAWYYREPRWLLPAYVHQLQQPYPTSYSEVTAFLAEHVPANATVCCFPDYTAYPVMFYLGDRLRFTGVLTRRDTALPIAQVESLRPDLFMEDQHPDWLVLFGRDPDAQRVLAYLQRPAAPTAAQYELAAELHVYWWDTSRPELRGHTFGPYRAFDPAAHSVFIYRLHPLPSSEAAKSP